MTHAPIVPLATTAMLALMLSLVGCHPPATIDERRPYPLQLVQGDTLDVQVVRDDTHIVMTNTTARTFGPSTLWINQWYSTEIDGFEPGETLRIHLGDFRDQFGDRFRAGGFFATDVPQEIALVQIESTEAGLGTLTGLVYVNEPGDR